MKCPKCGYLGFETTDRCRNCQYDFSLAPFASDPELTLHGAEHQHEAPNDFELPPIARQSDKLSAAALDEFWRAIKLDLYGTFLGCRFGIPAIAKSGGGSVINMSSNVALMGVPGRDCYTAA